MRRPEGVPGELRRGAHPAGLVHRVVTALAGGRPVVVVDDAGTGEGDLVVAAALASPQQMAFLVRHTSGFVSVALPHSECDRLDLPVLPRRHRQGESPDYCVTVDLAGPGTGISATERARTVVALAAPGARAADFTRPGHVIPVAVADGGVRERPGRASAAVDLARLAGAGPAVAMATLISEEHPSEMARGAELARFAHDNGLDVVPVSRVVEHLSALEPLVVRLAAVPVPGGSADGRRVVRYLGRDGAGHLALVVGDVDGPDVPLHVHTGCSTSDVLRSPCACGSALDQALAHIAARGSGVVVHAYPGDAVQSCGQPGRLTQGSPTAGEVAAAVLADLDVRSVRPLGVTPEVRRSLGEHGLASPSAVAETALAG